MTKNPSITQIYTPGVLSLLPMFYVAWADRVLSPTEVKLLEDKMANLQFLTEKDKFTLKKWCNPRNPPSRELFQQWKIILHNASLKMPKDKKQSLVEFGLVMAVKGATAEEDRWVSKETRAALQELEQALGFVHLDTYHSLFNDQKAEEIVASSFEVAAMTDLLDDDYDETRHRLRQLLRDPVFKYQDMPVKEDYREKVLEWTKILANHGYGALPYPKAHGGADDMGAYVAVFETLGHHDLSLAIKFGVQFGLFGGSVHALGTDKHHEKYLKDIGTCELLGCFAMTETGHGSNVRSLETTAEYDAKTDEFIVNTPHRGAGKEYIGNALHGEMASTFVQLIVNGENHGVHAILVPLKDKNGRRMPGIEVEDCGYKLGLNGVDNGRIWYDNVRVPRENLLNRFGNVNDKGEYSSPIENPSRRFFTMLGTLVGGRVSVPRAGLSAAKNGLTIAIKYALKRRQFGPDFKSPETLLLDYPSHQRRLMPLLAKAYALDFGLTYVAKRFVNRTEEDIREIETLAAGLKSYATWFTTETLQECREACGGKGYLTENRFAHLKAGSDIFTTFEGDNTVLMQLVAKGLLTEFKQQFHEEGTLGMLRFVGHRAWHVVAEQNVITKRRTEKEHLLSADFALKAFHFRRENLLYSLSQRLRGNIKNGMSSYDAVLKCQTHMLALAEAFVEDLILQKFVEKISEVEDDNLKKVLKKMCSLYALSTIEKHKGWYLEANYLEGVKTKAIRREVDALCAELRWEAGALVEAFGIPDELIGAQILQ
jgi:acyl-CoA oxidase